ncbi:MAG: ABC transporter permease [Myxococcota bacterium]
MKALWLLARLRILDVTRSLPGSLAFFGLPLAILLLLSLVFANGHPFERRSVAFAGPAPQLRDLQAQLKHTSELRVELAPSESLARRKLEVRAVEAVIVQRTAERMEVLVASRSAIWGRGLAALLPGSQLSEIETSSSGYLHYLFPGLVCSGVMLAGLYGMGYAMARYRQNAFLKKLATTPLPRSTFVIAQVLGRSALVLLQVGLLLAVGLFVFALPAHFAGLLATALITVLGLLVFSGIGFALACVIRTEAIVNDVISALTLPFTLFSGIFFPLHVLPQPLYELCRLLPSTLMVDATRETLLYGASIASVQSELLGLGAWGVVTFALSIRLFRWHD